MKVAINLTNLVTLPINSLRMIPKESITFTLVPPSGTDLVTARTDISFAVEQAKRVLDVLGTRWVEGSSLFITAYTDNMDDLVNNKVWQYLVDRGVLSSYRTVLLTFTNLIEACEMYLSPYKEPDGKVLFEMHRESISLMDNDLYMKTMIEGDMVDRKEVVERMLSTPTPMTEEYTKTKEAFQSHVGIDKATAVQFLVSFLAGNGKQDVSSDIKRSLAQGASSLLCQMGTVWDFVARVANLDDLDAIIHNLFEVLSVTPDVEGRFRIVEAIGLVAWCRGGGPVFSASTMALEVLRPDSSFIDLFNHVTGKGIGPRDVPDVREVIHTYSCEAK